MRAISEPRTRRQTKTMHLAYRQYFLFLWIAWLIYWWIAAAGAKATVRRESIASRSAHIVPLAFAVLLLVPARLPLLGLDTGLLPRTATVFWVGAALTVAGLLYTVWARVHLKGNWSGTVTIKADHELVLSGPYAITRHPIYTGLLAAFLGSAIADGEVRGAFAFAIAAAALWRKLRMEERWLTERFGPAYADYKQRVAALVPKIF
jgi:protein-S-isoprenylcysteine O-methyltransferase Ste14